MAFAIDRQEKRKQVSLRVQKGREFAEPAMLMASRYSISSSVSPSEIFLHREIVARPRREIHDSIMPDSPRADRTE